MKIIVKILMIVLVSTFVLNGCGDTSKTDSKSVSTRKMTTELSKEQIERYAASALYKELKIAYEKRYDVSQTKYSVASIESVPDGWMVNGRYSLYDKYGNFQHTYDFSVKVQRNGNAKVTRF